MSTVLFRMTFKKNWVLLLIFFSVLLMYLTVMISMFDPADTQTLVSMLDMFPEEMLKALGFDSAITDITSYLASWLYGMLMLAFPMVYCIILGNRLVAKAVDNGSFAYTLSTPHSRVKIISTLAVYAAGSVILLFAAVFGAGVAAAEISFPGLMDINAFFKLNVLTMLVNVLAMSIAFFFSCLFNDSALSNGAGAGTLIAFLLMRMLGGASDKLEVLKEISIYGIFDPVAVVTGNEQLWLYAFYAVASLILLIFGVYIFSRKRLPL